MWTKSLVQLLKNMKWQGFDFIFVMRFKMIQNRRYICPTFGIRMAHGASTTWKMTIETSFVVQKVPKRILIGVIVPCAFRYYFNRIQVCFLVSLKTSTSSKIKKRNMFQWLFLSWIKRDIEVRTKL